MSDCSHSAGASAIARSHSHSHSHSPDDDGSHTAAAAPLGVPAGLLSWSSSSPSGCGPLLLDLRSLSAHRRRRLQPSRCVHWRTLDSAWFTLPAYGVPFALLMPRERGDAGAEEDEETDETDEADEAAVAAAAAAAGQSAGVPSLPPPAATADECGDAVSGSGDAIATSAASSSSSSSGALGVKARTKGAPPVAPSSPAFVYSRAAILSLLRFYGWAVPDEWAFDDGPALWAAARDAGIEVRGADDPLEPALLFRPAPCLLKHFADIHAQLCVQRSATLGAAAAATESLNRTLSAESQDPSSPLCKQARSATAACVSSSAHAGSASSGGSASTAATATSASTVASAASAATSSASATFSCLDVACGSGRDLAWLLHESDRIAAAAAAAVDSAQPSNLAARPTPLWRASGLDSSGGALHRAQSLARQLGVGERLRVARARINQSNGEWHFSAGAGAGADAAQAKSSTPQNAAAVPAVPADAPSASADPAPESQSQAAVVALSGAAQRREKRRQKDLLRASAAAAAAAAASTVSASADASSSPARSAVHPILAPAQYDLVLMMRFLSRTFILTQLGRLLKPGGFFLLNTFINDGVTVYAQPSNPEFRIRDKDELVYLCEKAGLVVLCNEIGRCEDGRPVSELVARKPWR